MVYPIHIDYRYYLLEFAESHFHHYMTWWQDTGGAPALILYTRSQLVYSIQRCRFDTGILLFHCERRLWCKFLLFPLIFFTY